MIAVVAVLMVQMPVDDVIDVSVVYHRLVAAALAVYMPAVVTLAIVAVTRRRSVVIAVVTVHMVQVPVYDVVDVSVVFHRLVAAALAVYVIVVVTFTAMIVLAHR
ncbi:hypothetical protein [Candidatus Palauibacter sp.]|uniref:hypothetical protein n=1 Tax=Candidatus Palauibacter sp. TaxID=3101350 RepID=UPI003B026EC6